MVFMVELKEYGIRCAAKVPVPRRYNADGRTHSVSAREYRVHLHLHDAGCTTALNSSGIAGLVMLPEIPGCIRVGEEFIILTSWVEGLSYQQMIAAPGEKEYTFIWSYCRALLQALWRVHEQGYVHGDVKPDNFLYSGHHHGIGTLIDFGFCDEAGAAFLQTHMNRLGV